MVGFVVRKFQPESGEGLLGVLVCLMLFQVFFATGVCGSHGVDCTGQHDTLHPDATDCGKYYRCDHGAAVYKCCPAGLHFHMHSNVCDWPHNVDCENGTRPDVTTAATTPTPTTPSPGCLGWHQFQCNNYSCIRIAARCDGVSDCSDSEDEADCACPGGEVLCVQELHCISERLLCDGDSDCEDSSDEVNCPANCTGYHRFECDGVCHYIVNKCDGEADCSDGRDETNCDGCGRDKGEFSCGDGTCIDEHRVCDTVEDCADGRDELEANCEDL